jgi:hypothetical protein
MGARLVSGAILEDVFAGERRIGVVHAAKPAGARFAREER